MNKVYYLDIPSGTEFSSKYTQDNVVKIATILQPSSQFLCQ